MGRETRLRQLTKNQRVAGITTKEFMHPMTQVANPSTLDKTPTQLKEEIKAKKFANIVPQNGYNENIVNKVKYDLDYALSLFQAFSIDPEDVNAVTLLEAAIDAYINPLTVPSDDYELEIDMLSTTIKSLQSNGATQEDILSAYTRASSLIGIVSLELLAKQLGISFDGSTTDIDLSQSIFDSIAGL